MRWRLPLLAGCLLLVAGCTSLTGGDGATGGLGPGEQDLSERPEHYRVATWNQSGLVEAFPNASDAYELRAVTPSDGIDFRAPNLTEREGALALHGIVWGGPGEQAGSTGREQFRVEEDRIEAILEDRRNESDVRALFHAFARNVTDANRSTVDGWADAFVDSREEVGTAGGGERRTQIVGYEVALERALVLDGLLERLTVEGADRRESPTGLTVGNATWSLRFQVPHVTATQRGEGTLTELTATTRGAVVLGLGTQGNLTAEEVRDRARDTFADLSLPDPTFEGFSTRTFEPR